MSKKKKIITILCVILSLLTLFSCKSNDENEYIEPYQYDDLSEFLTIGDYKNVSISDKEVNLQLFLELDSFYQNAYLYTEVFSEKVKHGDRVVIDFVGFIDGETFDGGNANDWQLLIGSSYTIDGFEDGIIGMSINETKNLNLVFPEDYDFNLANQAVTFSVTVKKIFVPPTLTDEICQTYTNYQTKDDFLAKLEKDIVCNLAWAKLLEDSTIIKNPSEYDEMYTSLIAAFEESSKETSLSLSEYVNKFGGYYGEYGLYSGISLSLFYSKIALYCQNTIKEDLVLYTIIRKEGITIGDEYYTNILNSYIEENGYEDYEALTKSLKKNEIIINTYYKCVIEIIYKNTTKHS